MDRSSKHMNLYIMIVEYNRFVGDKEPTRVWVDNTEVGLDKRTLVQLMKQVGSDSYWKVMIEFACFVALICSVIVILKAYESRQRKRRALEEAGRNMEGEFSRVQELSNEDEEGV